LRAGDGSRCEKPNTPTKLLSAMRVEFGGRLEKAKDNLGLLKGEIFMISSHSDALVFFGATGDLAYKKIFHRSKRW